MAAPSPEPTGGTVKYYDGIAFNDVPMLTSMEE